MTIEMISKTLSTKVRCPSYDSTPKSAVRRATALRHHQPVMHMWKHNSGFSAVNNWDAFSYDPALTTLGVVLFWINNIDQIGIGMDINNKLL